MNDGPGHGEQQTGNAGVKSSNKTGLILGVISVVAIAVLGYFFLGTMRRLNQQMAQVDRQTRALGQRVERAEQQSQQMAQEASQAAASAQAAAQERDAAKQAAAESAAQAQAAIEEAATAQQQANEAQQQASAAKQKANQAEQKAEQYRQQRGAELAQLQQVLGQIAQTRRTAMGLVMTLGSKSVRFDFDKADIKPQYRDILNRIAGVLMTLKGYSIYVYGYTDDVGTQAYNLKLSERRAEAVRDFLVQAGLNPAIIRTKGFGKDDPRVPGDSEQARAANRRVEIGIVDATLLFGNRVAVQ